MARAGYCKACQQNVFLDDSWGCVNGHDWSQIEGWYDTDDGQPIKPYWVEEAEAPQTPASEPDTAPEPELEPEPEPELELEPEPEPEPVDPVAMMRDVILDRVAAINLLIAGDEVMDVSRGDDYEAALGPACNAIRKAIERWKNAD